MLELICIVLLSHKPPELEGKKIQITEPNKDPKNHIPKSTYFVHSAAKMEYKNTSSKVYAIGQNNLYFDLFILI